jgi:transposase
MVYVLSEYKVKKIIKYFCEDIDASKTAKLLDINRNTINRYFNVFRLAIFYANQSENIKISGTFELDESYFDFASLVSLRVVQSGCVEKGARSGGKNPCVWSVKT